MSLHPLLFSWHPSALSWSFCPYWKLLRFHLSAINEFTSVLPLCYLKKHFGVTFFGFGWLWVSCLFLIFFSSFFFSRSLNYFSPAFTLVSCKFLSFFFRLNFFFHLACFALFCLLLLRTFSLLFLASSSDIAVPCFCPGLQSQLSHGGCIVSVLFFFALFGLVSVSFGCVYFYGSLCRFCASF